MRSGQKAGVFGHDIWGKRTSTHPEDILQSVQSHRNWFWKNRDLKLTIFGDFGHFWLKGDTPDRTPQVGFCGCCLIGAIGMNLSDKSMIFGSGKS